MLNPDSDSRLQLARERTEDLRRQYGGQHSQTAHDDRRRSDGRQVRRRSCVHAAAATTDSVPNIPYWT